MLSLVLGLGIDLAIFFRRVLKVESFTIYLNRGFDEVLNHALCARREDISSWDQQRKNGSFPASQIFLRTRNGKKSVII